jgi:polyisoprenoid-binding protein YceI
MKVTAEAGSCASSNAKRNKHIVSPDFLNAESYPTITFSAASDDQSPTPSSRTHRLDGEVTIKGQTSPLTFDVSELSIDGDAATFRSTATTDRFELGIDKLPSFVIARRLDIAVTATARRR